MAALLAEVEQQLVSQHQQLYACDAGLNYLRNKSELCAEHAKVYHDSFVISYIASTTCIYANCIFYIVNTEWNVCDLHGKHWL